MRTILLEEIYFLSVAFHPPTVRHENWLSCAIKNTHFNSRLTGALFVCIKYNNHLLSTTSQTNDESWTGDAHQAHDTTNVDSYTEGSFNLNIFCSSSTICISGITNISAHQKDIAKESFKVPLVKWRMTSFASHAYFQQAVFQECSDSIILDKGYR